MVDEKEDKLLTGVRLRLIELRTKKKLTHEDVFNDTGINIGRLETGKRAPTLPTLIALCSYYGITIQQFFNGIKQ